MTKLIIATHNAHKVWEIQAVLGDSFACAGLIDYPDAPSVVEDAETFAGNASRKALQIVEWLRNDSQPTATAWEAKTFVLADDSGLEVDALKGAPGVHSARFAAADAQRGDNCSDAANNEKLLRLLRNTPDAERAARFRCVLALTPLIHCAHTGGAAAPQMFAGACEGRIATAASGHGGFGYDPLFIPDGFKVSFAELGDETKNQISHRARALAELKNWFSTRPDRTLRT
ncbi:MAG: non-canonical purine NTP pyrophosphatase [Verrucomicrobia bacterium]|nr:non-canonical purine NTP pyrophosphatase [Verrucomicrobiota bacterium]